MVSEAVGPDGAAVPLVLLLVVEPGAAARVVVVVEWPAAVVVVAPLTVVLVLAGLEGELAAALVDVSSTEVEPVDSLLTGCDPLLQAAVRSSRATTARRISIRTRCPTSSSCSRHRRNRHSNRYLTYRYC